MNKHFMKQKSSYYGISLVIISLFIILCGFFFAYKENNKIDPIKDVIKEENKNEEEIYISTSGSEKELDDEYNKNKQEEENNYNELLDNINNNLRKNIEDEYRITIKYGKETSNYKIDNITTEIITNPSIINSALNRLQNALKLYPEGFFQEIRNEGIPLTIYLVNNYSDKDITGITDSSYQQATISIAIIYPFEESFYHESYHYIEKYLLLKGANFNSWDYLNPQEFEYGTIHNNYSYNITFNEDSYFVNNYAQTDASEDRASTFEYMMSDNKASCLNTNKTIWKKANIISKTIETVFKTVKQENTETWERYL